MANVVVAEETVQLAGKRSVPVEYSLYRRWMAKGERRNNSRSTTYPLLLPPPPLLRVPVSVHGSFCDGV
jgi:hypothetical protein